MPLPLGHSAIGFATHSLISDDAGSIKKWKLRAMIIVLSNLPDIDVLFGLILHNNGTIFHRGPTHSILFAIIMGYIASCLTKHLVLLPTIKFRTGFLLVFSHVIADFLLTDSPVSFLWPLKVSWSTGNEGWAQVFNAVFFKAGEDVAIVIVCSLIIILGITWRRLLNFHSFRVPEYSLFCHQLPGNKK